MNTTIDDIEILTLDDESPKNLLNISLNPLKNIIKDEDIEVLSLGEEPKIIIPTQPEIRDSKVINTIVNDTVNIMKKECPSLNKEETQPVLIPLTEEKAITGDKKKKLTITKKIYTKIILSFLILINAGVLVVMGSKVYTWYQNNKQIDAEVAEINKLAIDNNSVSPRANGKTNNITPKYDEYFDMRKTSIGDVDFAALKEKNKDTKGWIKVAGTEVNYPFVQSADNEYYLSHSFSGKKNYAGWVFLDFRNDINNLSKNTVIYGHGRLNNTMFGSLKQTVKEKWLSNPDNFYIETATENGKQVWQIFSTYTIEPESYYITTRFSDSQFQTFVDTIKGRSVHNFNTQVTKDDHILTLSSCYDNTKRVVVHAKLVKSN